MGDLISDCVYRKLFIALHQGGIQRIARTGYDLLDSPIIVVNAELKKLAQYPEKPIGDPIWDTYYYQQSMTQQMTWQFLEDYTIQRSKHTETPFWINWGLAEHLPRLVYSIKVNNVVEGYVGFLFMNTELTEKHLKITELIYQALEIEMNKNVHLESPRSPAETVFVKDLFQGKIKSEEVLKKWLKGLNLNLEPNYCVAVVEEDRLEKTRLHYLKNLLDKNSPNLLYAIIENSLYILFSNIDNQTTLKNYIKAKNQRLNNILEAFNLNIGVSNAFTNLLDIGSCVYQADRALLLGRNAANNELIHLYQDYVLENLMTYIRKDVETVNLYHPAINILREYDSKNGTQYLNTLRVFITSMCNHRDTANKLFIHRNTLHYRLKKLQEIAGISLEDTKLCTLLLFNFYLLDEKATANESS